jgi:endonuclease G, mitochondrial
MARKKNALARNAAIVVALIAVGVQIFTMCQKKAGTSQDGTQPPSSQAPGAPDSYVVNSQTTIHLEMGVPQKAANSGAAEPEYLLVRKQYALSYNSVKNVPNWVSSNLNVSYFGDAPRKQGQFMPDPDLPSQYYHVRHQDYTGTGYDRGHMVRSEERTATRADNDATFYTTNLLPQTHDLNAGPWLRLEEFCQYLAQRKKKELYVICGGIYPKNYQRIGKRNNVAVPERCFKIVVLLERGQKAKDVSENTVIIAAIMPNVEGIAREQWRQYQTTVDDIERATGYDFLTAVPVNVQKVIEARLARGLEVAMR